MSNIDREMDALRKQLKQLEAQKRQEANKAQQRKEADELSRRINTTLGYTEFNKDEQPNLKEKIRNQINEKKKQRAPKKSKSSQNQKVKNQPLETVVEEADEEAPAAPAAPADTDNISLEITEPSKVPEAPQPEAPEKPQQNVLLSDVKIDSQENALLVIFEYLKHAQSRGIFSIKDSAKLWECQQMFLSKTNV